MLDLEYFTKEFGLVQMTKETIPYFKKRANVIRIHLDSKKRKNDNDLSKHHNGVHNTLYKIGAMGPGLKLSAYSSNSMHIHHEKKDKYQTYYELILNNRVMASGLLRAKKTFIDVGHACDNAFTELVALMINLLILDKGKKIPKLIAFYLKNIFMNDIDLKVSFDSIMGMKDEKHRIARTIDVQLKNLKLASRNILLAGPPGTGKSMILKAIANKYSGDDICIIGLRGNSEFEKWIPILSELAKSIDLPLIILIDEIDEFCLTREQGARTYEFLRLMNGVVELDNVFMLATTNRLAMIDDALIRPERFTVYKIKYPEKEDRKEIFEYYLGHHDLKVDNADRIVMMMKKWSGAHIRSAIEDVLIFEDEFTEEILIKRIKELNNEKKTEGQKAMFG